MKTYIRSAAAANAVELHGDPISRTNGVGNCRRPQRSDAKMIVGTMLLPSCEERIDPIVDDLG
jgi:hypothetical protein